MFFKEAIILISFITFNTALALGAFWLYNSIKASVLPIAILLPLIFAALLTIISIRAISMQFNEWKCR